MSDVAPHPEMRNEDIRAILEDISETSQILSKIKEDLGDDRPLDAQAWLAEHPDVGARKSIVLDLAYEEFCQRLESGEPVDAESFARRFPSFERSVRRLIAVHDFLEQNVGLVPTKPTQWPEPGQVFQGFTILAELGRGSFAKVFLAEESSLGNRLVAIKLSSDGAAEADILGRLQHPNIVPVYSVRRDEGTGLTVICMPYLGRTTLLDVLDRLFAQGAKPAKASSILEALRAHAGGSTPGGSRAGPADVKLRRGSFVDGAVHLGRQLADALSYAHGEGICHSDLKPSNVLISPQGVPMLLDFNLAFARGRGRHLGGTLPYMAPEHLHAMEMPFDKEQQVGGELSDLFSLGVILYELLSGRLPFGPVSTNCSWDQMKTDLLERQQAGPLPLGQANQEVDAGLANLVESCVAFDPDQRPQSAKALAAALRRAISPNRKAQRWARQHRRAVLCALASLVMACLGIGYHYATRPPYDVCLIEQGLYYYRQGQYAQGRYADAERYFSMAIKAAEDKAEAYYWRARARQKAGRMLLAIDDYEEVARRHPDAAPQIAACLAYCWALEGYPGNAVQLSQRAISSGFHSAEVYNNLGYSYLRLAEFEAAQKVLDEAIRINERLQAALYNRAFLELRWARKDERLLHPKAAEDIQGAIQAGPPTANLYLDAARIYSRLAQEPGQHDERIAGYLAEAVRLGADRAELHAEFNSLVPEAIPGTASDDAEPTIRHRGPIRLVDPLQEELFRPDQVK